MDDSSQSVGSVIEDENGGNFHVPLALRKTPRAHAGINPFRMEFCDNTSPKESSTVKKRTLSSGSSGSKESRSSTPQPPPLKKKRKTVGQNKDSYCWICHKDCSNLMSCEACPRVFHPRCVGYETAATHEWFCSECEKVVSSENVDTRSKAMKMLTIDQLCSLLRYALNRMKEQGDEAFLKPVSLEQFPNYIDFVFMPMDLSTLEKNIKKKMYGCTESFLADAKWILHNCVIFNGYHHKLTSSAKQIVKICKHEMNEIEACPDCYLHAYTKRNNWFCEPCREPHLLVWAKLKGFPFWPAKAMKVSNDNVDVRFFGAHDRAWIPVNQCFLLSKDIPTPLKNKKKGNFELSVEELELHIQKLKGLYGAFQYAPFRTTLEVEHIDSYIHTMLPEAVFDLTPNATPFLPNKKPKLQVSSLNPQMSSKESVKEESKKSNDGGRMTVIKQPVKEENPKSVNLLSQDKGNSEVPSGVFESSKDLPSLDLQIPKLDLTKVPKPRLESIKKLESAIERLKDSTIDKTEEEAKENTESKVQVYSQDNLKDSTQKIEESDQNYQDPQNDSALPPQNHLEASSTITSEGKLTISQSCEVTSTTNLTELTVDIPPPQSDLLDNKQPSSKSSTSSLNSPKKTNIYTQKLDQMIESCKAKLGIDEIREDLSSEESSDEESFPKYTVLTQNKNSKEESTAKENKDSGSSINKTQISLPMTNKPGTEKFKSNKNKDVSRNDDDEVEPSNEDTGNHHSTQLRQLLQKPVINQNELSKSSKDNSASSEKEGKRRSSTSLKDHADIPVGRCSSEADADVAESNTNSEGEETDEGTLIIDLERNDTPETVVVKENQNKISTLFSNLRTLVDTNSSRLKSPPVTREKRLIKRSRVASRDDAGRKDTRTLPLLSPLGRKKSNNSYMYTNNQPLDLVCGRMEEMLKDAAKSGNLESSVKALQLEIEKLQWRHQQELAEIKHNTDLVLLEMRASMDSEKQRAVAEVRRQCEIEKMKAIDETKKKQWCAHCGKEAIFYCCWNTSYCDYPCQQAHWPQHMSTCAQSQGGNDAEGQESPPAPSNIIVTSVAGQAKSSESLSNQIQRAVSLQQGPSDTCTISPSSNKRQDSARQGAKQAKNRDSWHKRTKEESNLNYLQQQERDKQRMHLQMQSQSSVISQASANAMGSQYSTSLGPSVQYIPSNAVQVIPQTSSLASPSALTSPSALQVQYVTNIPQNHPSISMGSTSGTMPHFTTMTSAPAFPLQQSAQHQNHNILHQQQQRSLQVSNSMYPIIIQSSAAALGLSENSSGGRAYHPRGPYIPGKPYHVS